MSKHKIRKDKTCQNCGSFVEKNYCPNCGQENSLSRQSFYHLFTHFVSDYLHYDSSFWKSIKCMLFHPGRLSKEYMDGRRKSYINPFTLYIFISFITFFIPPILPEPTKGLKGEKYEEVKKEDNKKKQRATVNARPVNTDSLELKGLFIKQTKNERVVTGSESQVNFIYKIFPNFDENINDKVKLLELMEFAKKNLPKVLFVYMPLFAFLLWLFHSKKKFYYFDSGIFTLHFLSVVLLSITIGSITVNIADWLNWEWLEAVTWIFFPLYVTFYFFRGSRIFYAEKRWVSNIKSFMLMIINFFLMLFVFILYTFFVMYIHLA